MPQLDTSTWLTTILSMIITLFIVFQLKISKLNFPLNPMSKITNKHKSNNPWETKWTKIYSPHSLSQQS
uniref:ATP synthase complex subunit 8 n=2 Tax=Boreoeutheria TaxID=1437010 RepID=A0A3S6C7Q9_ALLTR|nr:ATP synthase F0 subunit 8 [Allocebus trichotus]AIW64354.1 ATP synthase F0 subunit 8 [Allocebus trichotus]AIW64367.1 ATP synthase F0 subunit 8 [Allocebus trichotus]